MYTGFSCFSTVCFHVSQPCVKKFEMKKYANNRYDYLFTLHVWTLTQYIVGFVVFSNRGHAGTATEAERNEPETFWYAGADHGGRACCRPAVEKERWDIFLIFLFVFVDVLRVCISVACGKVFRAAT